MNDIDAIAAAVTGSAEKHAGQAFCLIAVVAVLVEKNLVTVDDFLDMVDTVIGWADPRLPEESIFQIIYFQKNLRMLRSGKTPTDVFRQYKDAHPET